MTRMSKLTAFQEAFCAVVSSWTQDSTLAIPPPRSINGEPYELSAIARKLWSVGASMPDQTCEHLDGWDALDVPLGSSFAKGARIVIALLTETERLQSVKCFREAAGREDRESSAPDARRGPNTRRRRRSN